MSFALSQKWIYYKTYNTPFFDEKKELFYKFFQKFTDFYQRCRKQPDYTGQSRQKFVQNCKKWSAGGEKPQNNPKADAAQHEQPQNAITGIECQQQKQQQSYGTEQQIQQDGKMPVPPAQSPQQVVDQPETQTRRAGDGELQRLQRDGQFHQRNRRENRPPDSRPSSP